MILILGKEHYVLKLYKVMYSSSTSSINDYPELTLTYFTTMSKLVKIYFVLAVGQDIRWCLQDQMSSGFTCIRRRHIRSGLTYIRVLIFLLLSSIPGYPLNRLSTKVYSVLNKSTEGVSNHITPRIVFEVFVPAKCLKLHLNAHSSCVMIQYLKYAIKHQIINLFSCFLLRCILKMHEKYFNWSSVFYLSQAYPPLLLQNNSKRKKNLRHLPF